MDRCSLIGLGGVGGRATVIVIGLMGVRGALCLCVWMSCVRMP